MATQDGVLRERLLVAAGRLLDDGGVEAVTIREVARRAGVSHGAPRRPFPTRALLLAALAQDGFNELMRALTVIDNTEPAARQLVQGGRAYLAFARSKPALFDLMTRHDLLEDSGAHLRATSLTTLTRWHDLVQAARPQATKRDSLLLFAAVHGVAVLDNRKALKLLDQDATVLVDAVLEAPRNQPDSTQARRPAGR